MPGPAFRCRAGHHSEASNPPLRERLCRPGSQVSANQQGSCFEAGVSAPLLRLSMTLPTPGHMVVALPVQHDLSSGVARLAVFHGFGGFGEGQVSRDRDTQLAGRDLFRQLGEHPGRAGRHGHR